jgi:hypothetical protein
MVRPASWWDALVKNGLDRLSPPELEVAVQELTHDRGAFVGLLAAASDYPRVSMASVRRPDPSALDELDRTLPLARAVVAPEDVCAVAVAATHFEAVLALDPLWHAPELLYGAWHRRGGISASQGQALVRLAAPTAHLGALIASRVVWLVPDHLPGRWQPFLGAQTRREGSPTYALARAARLLYWAHRLGGGVVSTDPTIVPMVRLLASTDDERAVSLDEPGLDDVPAARAGRATEWQRWTALLRARAGPDRHRCAAALVEDPGHAGATAPWALGLGASALPDVALVLRRAQAGRDLRDGPRGVPIRLRRPSVYLVREQSIFENPPAQR